jgi:hypothetical protein
MEGRRQMTAILTRSRRHVTTWRELVHARLDGIEAALAAIDAACPAMDRASETRALVHALRADLIDQERLYIAAIAHGEPVSIPAIWLNWSR